MNTIIEKTLDVIMKMAKKIPRGLMYLLIFTLLFPLQASFIINNSLSLFFAALPNSIQVFLDRISTQYVINFFATTLILLGIAIIWDIAFKADRGIKNIDLDPGILFDINSIGLISFLIYNKISSTPITIATINESLNFSFFYLVSVLFSMLIFLFIFSMTHLFFLWIPFKKMTKIQNPILLLFMIMVYLVVLSFLVKYISKEATQGFITVSLTSGLF
ncbi:hypothetical protein [Enterococcus avium]|uniref:hypothetical protein n=1 Tax=Enterococcus avium TaxID=33945 RepID=UPI0037B20C82